MIDKPNFDTITPDERAEHVLDAIHSATGAIRLGVAESNLAYALAQRGEPIVYQTYSDEHFEAGWHSVKPPAESPPTVKPSLTVGEIITVTPIPLAPRPPKQAGDDEQLIRLWLHGRSPATIRAYRFNVELFRKAIPKPLLAVTLADLQDFADSLGGAIASNILALSAVKSLFDFGHRLGYLPFDTAAALKLPKKKDELSGRILTEGQVHKLLNVEVSPRDHGIMVLFYATGIRISELCSLTWKDGITTEEGDGLLSVFGKGGKTRFIRVPQSAWSQIVALRGFAELHEPIFKSEQGGSLDESQVHRIVKAVAKRAGVDPKLSAHWLRHAHASHAIDRGAPVSLVQATLGHASLATTGRYLHARPKESSGKYLGL